IRTINQRCAAHRIRFRIAVQDIAEIGVQAHGTAQPATDNAKEAEVADVATRAGAALQLVKAAEVISLVGIKPVEAYESEAERIVRSGEAILRTDLHGAEGRLAVQPVNKWRVRQIGRTGREQIRYGQSIESQVWRNGSRRQH